VAAAQGFDEGYLRWRASNAHSALMGDGLPSEVEPFSFVPLDGLESLATLLDVRRGQLLVDLGCGRGGPGLWLARRVGAGLIGVDGSGVALADARQRLRLFPGVSPARFEVADVACTGLPDACADAVVSIDVLQLLDDQAAMIYEAARLVRPGGRVVLTSWEGWGAAPGRFPRDIGRLVEHAGMRVEAVTEQPEWLRRQLRIYEQAALDSGDDAALRDLAEEGRRWQRWSGQTRRVVVAARRAA
jgi:SAM-dependent methyltransferase